MCLVNSNLPLLLLLQPRIEELKILNANLLRRTRELGLLVLLTCTSPKDILEVRVDRVFGWTFSRGEGDEVEVEGFALLEKEAVSTRSMRAEK
jgi:hypothetical protein